LANKVKIEIVSQPANYTVLGFSMATTGYLNTVSKTFIPGFDSTSNYVAIGADAEATLTNLHAKLVSFESDGNVSFELDYPYIYCNFTVEADYVLTVLNDAGDSFAITTETVSTTSNDVLLELVWKHISIRIFDTYVNERILIQELAGADACVIDWDGGDDVYKALAVSKCVFNMLVPEADDAHFKHLFTSDEQRFRVEVVGIDEEENELLIWQGFLLPDQYNEPYKNVSFFVDFTAVDMVGTLKGKYFPQWYYENKFPVGQLLAYILAETGLSQNIICKPSVLPADAILTFDAITVDLKAYRDGGKLKDLHEVLEKVLESLTCTLFSFRGYWWVEGVTRRADVEVTAIQFDTNGIKIQDIEVVKPVVDCGYKLQTTPLLTALTPWKQVNLTFKADGTKNLFTDNVVKVADDQYFKTAYTTGNYTGTGYTQPEVYTTHLLNNWNFNLNSDFLYLGMVGRQLLWKVINPATYGGNDYTGYNYTQSAVLTNYIECAEKPFVKEGVLYEFEVQLKVETLNFDVNSEAVKNRLDNGSLDAKLFPFQIFIGGVEKFSNRFAFSATNLYRYKIVSHEVTEYNNSVGGISVSDGYNNDITFSLKFSFRPEADGELSYRILMPTVNDLDFIRVGGNAVFKCESLKLTAIDGLDESEDTIAIRDINYTQELDYDLGLTCTQDNSILNSFGLNRPLNQDYFKTIARTDTPYPISGYHYYSPTTALELELATWKTTDLISKLLFRNGLKANCFLEKVSGLQVPFTALWVFFNNPVSRMGYLTAYDGFPNIPKNYTAYPDVDADDVLKYMEVEYPAEDYQKRLDWKLYGSETIDTFPKTIAKALHGVRPEQIYRLDATALCLLFPDNLIDFYFDNNDRNFIPTKLTLNLFKGKTTFVATEAKFTELTDISYE